MATSSADGWFAYHFYPFFVALWALSKSSTFHFVWVVLSELISCQDGYIRPMKSPRAYQSPFRPCDRCDRSGNLYVSSSTLLRLVFMALGWFRDRKVVGPLRPEEASGSFLGLETLETHHDGGSAGTLFACLKGEKNISHAWFWRYPPAIKHCENIAKSIIYYYGLQADWLKNIQQKALFVSKDPQSSPWGSIMFNTKSWSNVGGYPNDLGIPQMGKWWNASTFPNHSRAIFKHSECEVHVGPDFVGYPTQKWDVIYMMYPLVI